MPAVAQPYLQWARLLAPLVVERLGGDDTLLRAQTIAHASLACFDIALTAWAEPAQTRSPVELLGISFAAMHNY